MVEYKGASPGSSLSLRVKLALGGAGADKRDLSGL